jgi:hypothetical protein
MRNRTFRQGVLSAVREELLKKEEDKRPGQMRSEDIERERDQRKPAEPRTNSSDTLPRIAVEE